MAETSTEGGGIIGTVGGFGSVLQVCVCQAWSLGTQEAWKEESMAVAMEMEMCWREGCQELTFPIMKERREWP
jgi:hypothetical protein